MKRLFSEYMWNYMDMEQITTKVVNYKMELGFITNTIGQDGNMHIYLQ